MITHKFGSIKSSNSAGNVANDEDECEFDLSSEEELHPAVALERLSLRKFEDEDIDILRPTSP